MQVITEVTTITPVIIEDFAHLIILRGRKQISLCDVHDFPFSHVVNAGS
jgi:hypothetical protein